MTDALAERLAARTLELIDIASESRDEAALAAHVLGVLEAAGVGVEDSGDSCLLAGQATRGDRPLVLLAGHFDTVPAQDNRPGRIDGDTVFGLGAADMKGALAVMIELAVDRAGSGGPLDLGCVFFGREELPFGESALGPLLERSPGLRTADLVVVMEPTAGAVQAGCLGNLNATWSFEGRSGHSARPWLADNALYRAARGVEAIAALEPVDHDGGRAQLPRGRLGDRAPRRDRPQRHSRIGLRARQPPLPARDERRGRRAAPARAVRAPRRADDRRQRAVRRRPGRTTP